MAKGIVFPIKINLLKVLINKEFKMKRDIGVIILSVLLVFALAGCKKNEPAESMMNHQQWNTLSTDQKHIKVATELKTIESAGLTVSANEYYFTDRLDYYFKENPTDEIFLKEVIIRIGLTNGVIH
jgi:hypothetical protein